MAHRPNSGYNVAPMKIALIGSHGVGKTTLCFELAAEFKRRGADVEMVREVARSSPLPRSSTSVIGMSNCGSSAALVDTAKIKASDRAHRLLLERSIRRRL